MRHVRQHREETLTEWANRLELNGYFPVTDDLTNELASRPLEDFIL